MRDNKPTDNPLPILDPSGLEITEAKFLELAKSAADIAEKMCLEQGDIQPHLLVYFRTVDWEAGSFGDLECAYVSIADFNPDNKKETMQRIGKSFYERKWCPAAVFFVSEAWASTASSMEAIDRGDFIPPSQDPNRKEALSIAGRCMGTEQPWGYFRTIGREGTKHFADEPCITREVETWLLDQFFVGFTKEIHAYGSQDRKQSERRKPR